MRRAYQTPETRKEYFENRKDVKKEYDKLRRTEKAEEIKVKKREAYLKDRDKNTQNITLYLWNNYSKMLYKKT